MKFFPIKRYSGLSSKKIALDRPRPETKILKINPTRNRHTTKKIIAISNRIEKYIVSDSDKIRLFNSMQGCNSVTITVKIRLPEIETYIVKLNPFMHTGLI